MLTCRSPDNAEENPACTIPGEFKVSLFCHRGRKTWALSRGTRTQAGTSCPYVVWGLPSPLCPTAKAVPHLSSSTLRRSSWTRCLSTLSMFPATSLRISPITTVTSSSTVASEALCRNSKSLLKARIVSFKVPGLYFSQPHLALCGGLTPAISQAHTHWYWLTPLPTLRQGRK